MQPINTSRVLLVKAYLFKQPWTLFRIQVSDGKRLMGPVEFENKRYKYRRGGKVLSQNAFHNKY